MNVSKLEGLEVNVAENRTTYEPGEQINGIPPDIQRWCIVRKYGQDTDDPNLNIEVAYPSDKLLTNLTTGKDPEDYFATSEKDQLEWWRDEYTVLKFPQSKFRSELEAFSDYLVDKPAHEQYIEEGMVFIRIETKERRYVHFTYQARNLSEKVYSQLTGDVVQDQSPSESQ
jgi:hypothetical protein